MHRVIFQVCMFLVFLTYTAYGQPSGGQNKLPIIDMHLHAFPANWFGPPPVDICHGDVEFPAGDPRGDPRALHTCSEPFVSPLSDSLLMQQTLAMLTTYNIIGVASGPLKIVKTWHETLPNRIIPALLFNIRSAPSVDSLRQLFNNHTVKVFGEVLTQYEGIAPGDSILAPYWTLAEELDIPVGIHIGPGPPGIAYTAMPKFRAALGNPLLLEPVLLQHPKLRVYVMHAGHPMIDAMLALLYAHPQVYVDIGVICFVLPRSEFHHYLRRIVEAGFGSRIMFGSDQMLWPQAIETAIEAVETADFLSAKQKRDIFYNNAARFLRLSDDEIARHHSESRK